jgi:hypothetical protein
MHQFHKARLPAEQLLGDTWLPTDLLSATSEILYRKEMDHPFTCYRFRAIKEPSHA